MYLPMWASWKTKLLCLFVSSLADAVLFPNGYILYIYYIIYTQMNILIAA